MRLLQNSPVALFVVAVSLPAQAPVKFRTTTRLIEISVVAHDKRGEPIRGLTKSDFELFDSGVRQEIAFISEGDGTQTTQPSALPPAVFSNRAEHRIRERNATVILLDALNTQFADQSQARREAIHLLEQIHPQDRVAIFALGQDLKLLQHFTDDPTKLLAALRAYHGQSPGELQPTVTASEPPPTGPPGNSKTPPGSTKSLSKSDPIKDVFSEWIETATRRSFDTLTETRVLWTAHALAAIGRYLAGVPGRKSLIWISSSFPISIGDENVINSGRLARETRSLGPQIEEAARVLSDSNVAVYPIDARGLAPARGMDADAAEFPTSNTARLSGFVTYSPAPLNLDALEILAQRTGGRAFYSTNELSAAIRSAMDDGTAAYTLGFYPKPERLDGEFHKIRVRATQKDAQIRYRSGYFAGSEKPLDDKQVTAEIQSAVLSPVDSGSIGMIIRAETANEPLPGSVKFTIRVDAANVSLEPFGQRWNGKLEIVIAQTSKEGKVLRIERQTVDLSLAPENYQSIIRDHALLLWKSVVPQPDLAEFRLVVADTKTGALGSIRIPFTGTER